MPGAVTTKQIRDANGIAINIRVWDESGAGTGPFSFFHVLGADGGKLAKAEDSASGSADEGLVILAKRSTTPANTSDTNGDYEPLQVNDGRLYTESDLHNIGAGDYESVLASANNQVLGGSGAAGDYLSGLLIVPGTTSPGAVTIADGSSSPDIQITVFAGGAASVSNLVPFTVPLGIKSLTGGWRVTTGSNVTVIAVGNFT